VWDCILRLLPGYPGLLAWTPNSRSSIHFWFRGQNEKWSGGPKHGLEGLSLHTHHETYWSKIMMWILQNFHRWIILAVKICRQCLQTVSFSRGLCLLTPLEDFCAPESLDYNLQMKIPGTATEPWAVWFKLPVTEMTINGNKSNPLTVTVTEIPVTETFSKCHHDQLLGA